MSRHDRAALLCCLAVAGLLATAAAGGEPIASIPAHIVSAASDPNAIRVLLTASPESTIASPMAGRLQTMDVQLGKQVKKGEIIFRLDCAEPQARMRMAAAELAGARETLRAKLGLRKLDAAGDTEVVLARVASERAAAALALAQAQVDYCTVVAPYAGRIAKLYVRPYESVNVGSPLADLVSDGPLKLRMNLPSRDLRHVQVGTEFDIDVIETGSRYRASVMAINARIDAVAQSVELEGLVQDPAHELLPGMSGIADFHLPR